MIRISLSGAAHIELFDFCKSVLKPGLDAARYAESLVNENWEFGEVGGATGALFEIAGRDTKSGNPETISFNKDEDFLCIEEDV